jgi:hypothetical protein
MQFLTSRSGTLIAPPILGIFLAGLHLHVGIRNCRLASWCEDLAAGDADLSTGKAVSRRIKK